MVNNYIKGDNTMKKRAHVPGSRTLMPIVVEVLQKNGGTLTYTQVWFYLN